MSIKEYARVLMEQNPMYKGITEQQELLWINDKYLPFDMTEGLCHLVVSDKDIQDAEERLQRFAPYIVKSFPETEADGGIIESPLQKISSMKSQLEEAYDVSIPGQLMLKMDSHLPIAGSVKARGGIYEVLKHAEELAITEGKVTMQDDYARFADEDMKAFFRQYTVQVGSTGNLGLSIGIMSAKLGFKVKVHMSADARQWKKDLLRSEGVEVIEYEDDYSKAVENGRKDSAEDEFSYFIDDEYSVPLFLGYAVAAGRLKKQLEKMDIVIDENHPLFVYIPCGVGGAPGGICYGLKRVFKDNVHVFFCEPTKYPSVLLGMATNLYNEVNVRDFGLDEISAADGLACASPSGFVTRIDRNLVSGDFTVADEKLFEYLKMFYSQEQILIEPSSCAAFQGPVELQKTREGRQYLEEHGLMDNMQNSIQICWATGGKLVPKEEWEKYIKQD